MPEIKSPISRQMTSNEKGYRTFEVSDETQDRNTEPYEPSQEYQGRARPEFETNVRHQERHTHRNPSDVETDIRNARRAKVTGNVPLTDFGRERVQILTGLGQKTKSVLIGGITFEVRTLSGKEQRECIMAANKTSAIEVLFEGRVQQLARALVTIDGRDVEEVLGTRDLQVRLDFVEDMQDHVLDKLYEEFNNLLSEVKKEFYPQADADMKEVVEDIKK